MSKWRKIGSLEEEIKLLNEMYNTSIRNQKPKVLTKFMLDSADKVITVCDLNDCVLILQNYKVGY